MWSHLSLFLIVGVAVSYCDHHQTVETHEYAWNKGKEYKYLVRSTTMTSLDDPHHEATGITMKGILVVQAVTPNVLHGKVHELQYAHKEEIPKTQPHEGSQEQDETHHNVPISGKPFQITVKNGVIREMMVQKEVPIWEVNILKSIISQLQVDTSGENIIPSKYNQIPEDTQHPFASYKVMEDSVSGNCEVIYDIVPMEEDIAKSKPEMIPLPSLDGKNFIEIRKTKDFRNCKELHNYRYNQNNQRLSWPYTSKSDPDPSVLQVSTTRMIISGNLKQFTTQSSVTKSTIFIKSDKKDRVIGNVNSMINLTLVEVNSGFKHLEQKIDFMTPIGNLVFMDKNPFAESQIHPRPISQNLQQIQSSDKSRLKEILRSDFFDSDSKSDSSSSEEKNPEDVMSAYPRLTEAPYNPFMPVFIGFSGKNSSEDFNPVVLAANLIMRIAKAIEDPTLYKPDEMIETFTILQDLLRTMVTDQLTEVEQRVLKLGDSIRDKVEKVIHKTIAQIGTGPSLLKLTNWIKNGVFSNVDAAILVARLPKTVRTLTAEYLKHFYELISMPEMMDKDVFNVSAPIAFAQLIRTAQDERRRYPPNSYGHTMITDEELDIYISHFAKQLTEAMQKNNSQRIHTYIAAISYTGHPKMLSVFEPYLEGKQPVSKCQLRMMVTGLSSLARTYPTLARSVLGKIYLNTRENDEIRIAAFFSLIKTDPPLITYLRMAQFTNYDRSPLVNSAVVSIINSLATLKHAKARNIAFKARLARELSNKKVIGSLHSTGYYIDTDNEDTLLRSFYVERMGSGKTDVNYVHVGLNIVNDYLKLFNFRFGYGVSDIKQIRDFFHDYYKLLLPKQEKQKRTLVEELVSALNVETQPLEPLEGYLFSDSKYETQFYPFDKNSFERDIRRTVTNMSKVLSEDFSVNNVYNHDEIFSFPTETGLPFVHTIQTPIVQKFISKDPEISLDKDFEIETAIKMLFASRVQKRWGFTVPFELQQYHAGIDRDFHTYLPITLKIKKLFDQVQLQLGLNPELLQKNQQDHSLIHFSTVPFVIRHDVLDFEPLSRNSMLQGKIHETSKRNKFQVGIFQILTEGHKKMIQTPLSHIIKLFSSASQEENSYKRIDISVNTPVGIKGLHLNVAHAKSNTNSPATQQLELQKFEVTDRQPNSEARRKQFLTEVSKGLQSSHNHVWDIDVGYPTNTSQKRTHQVITIGVGHSNANEEKQFVFYWNIQPELSESVDYEIFSTGRTEISQKTPLDFERMLNKHEQRYTSEFNLQYGKNYVDGKKVQFKGNALQSNDLKNMLRNNEITKECLRNLKDNKESQACQKAIQLVQLVDLMNFSVATDSDALTKKIENLFNLLSRVYNRIVEKSSLRRNKKNIIDVEIKMLLDRDQTDVFVSSFDKDISLSLYSLFNSPLLALSPSTLSWEWLSEVSQFVSTLSWPLPVEVAQQLTTGLLSTQWLEHIQSQWIPSWRLLSLEKQIDSMLKDAQQPSTCNVGKHQVTTFDGKTYPISEEKNWQVLVIPTPRYEKTIPEDEKMGVLIREKDGHKEIRFLLGSKDIDIRKTNDDIQVLVDGRPVKQYHTQDKPDNTSYQIHDNDKVDVEIYELPDKSIEMKSCKYGAHVVYNGEAVAIQVADQYANRILGLCGNYDSKPDNDFLSPQNCIAQKSQDFNAMYTLVEDSQHGYTALNKDKQYPCVQQTHYRSNVISDIEAGRSPLDWSPYSKKASHNEIKDRRTDISFTYRTKIQEKDDELCFSTRPIPMCEKKNIGEIILPTKTKSKTFEFFCVPKNEASEQLKLRIEKGANPDFSQKPVSFKKAYEVPLTCRAA